MVRHMTIEQLPYGRPILRWLKSRYGETETNKIWKASIETEGEESDR